MHWLENRIGITFLTIVLDIKTLTHTCGYEYTHKLHGSKTMNISNYHLKQNVGNDSEIIY